MLVLSRKAGEEIVIDGQVRVRILRAEGNRVRIGIEAPRSMQIQRGELMARIGPAPSTLASLMPVE